MKRNKQALIKKAETIIGKLTALQHDSGGSIKLQTAAREVRSFIENECK